MTRKERLDSESQDFFRKCRGLLENSTEETIFLFDMTDAKLVLHNSISHTMGALGYSKSDIIKNVEMNPKGSRIECSLELKTNHKITWTLENNQDDSVINANNVQARGLGRRLLKPWVSRYLPEGKSVSNLIEGAFQHGNCPIETTYLHITEGKILAKGRLIRKKDN